MCAAQTVAAQGDKGIRRISGDAQRIALVVGNNAYAKRPLQNAVNDARAISAILRDLKFEVQTVEDASYRDLAKAVDAFIGRLGAGDVGLFYYSGHGLQIEGTNYLVPIDFNAPDQTEAKYQSYEAERVRERMEKSGSQLNIVVLDACRDNPFAGTRSGSGGLALMSGGAGTFIAYATGPGQTADDNQVGQNGLFTHYLLDALKTPGLKLNEVFDRTAVQVHQASKGRQVPWMTYSMIGDFYFAPGGNNSSAAVPPPPVVEEVALGHLQVIANAPNSQIFVNGTHKGAASPGQPLNLSNMPVGTVRVAVKASGYQDGSGTFVVRRNEWTQAQISLAAVAPPPPPVTENELVIVDEYDTAPESQPVIVDEHDTTTESRPVIVDDHDITTESESAVVGEYDSGGACGNGMVLVPAGEFIMGRDDGYSDEKPAHRVYIDAYCIDLYEVTVDAFKSCVESGPCRPPTSMGDGYTWEKPGLESHPINDVHWFNAATYCKWAGKRLPTEAEWEKAARGTDGRRYPWGNEFKANSANAHEFRDLAGYTAPVGSYASDVSPYGVFDMFGNVQEWVWDRYDDDYYDSSPSRNPFGPKSGYDRVIRGLSFNGVGTKPHIANRRSQDPRYGGWMTTGFRCAKPLDAAN